MTHEDLCTLVDYHYWARDRMITALEPLPSEEFTRELGGSFPSLRATLVHLCGAEWVWHSRWRGRSPASIQSLLAESESPLDQLESICHFWSRLQQQIVAFVRELGDEGITRTFSYTLFSGASFSSPYWQTVQHLVNHGSYHRGQVTNMLRQLGAAPAPPTDLIAYYREVRG